MKKLHCLALIGLLLVGCGPPPPVQKAPPPNMPSWALNIPSQEGYLYGVGSAKKQNPQLARTAAIGLARDEIARALEVCSRILCRNLVSVKTHRL